MYPLYDTFIQVAKGEQPRLGRMIARLGTLSAGANGRDGPDRSPSVRQAADTAPGQQALVRARAPTDGGNADKRRGAPPPAAMRRAGIMHLRRPPAETYVLAVQGARETAFKIGWAFDHKARTAQFNQAAMPELGGLRYEPVLRQRWGKAADAFRMEHELLRRFDAKRHPRNREIVTGVPFGELSAAWAAALSETRRARR